MWTKYFLGGGANIGTLQLSLPEGFQKKPVILSEAGNHGRSRRTSNIRGFLRGANSLIGLTSAFCDHTGEKAEIAPMSDRGPFYRAGSAFGSAQEPAEDGGPSAPPVLPRFAQDDRFFLEALRAGYPAMGEPPPSGSSPL
jgi:hypothetical protein